MKPAFDSIPLSPRPSGRGFNTMSTDLLPILFSRGLITAPANVKVTSLAGGVSCDIFLIEEGDTKFVLKRALAKLRVKDDWFADVNRNQHEQDYLDYAYRVLPANFPKILHRDPEHGFFTMEYLGPEYHNWKTQLLAGRHESKHSLSAALSLAAIHTRSWNDPVAKQTFNTGKNFYDLRIHPYLITTGQRNPPLQSLFDAEAKRLAATHLCLVHGDYSPKNMLISDSRGMKILDCEVAWFGDPAFDIAFLLNHLVLKMLLFRRDPDRLLHMALEAWSFYIREFTPQQREGLEARTARLLLMLMLARIDGKSPVEYLREEIQQRLVRQFVMQQLTSGRRLELANVVNEWFAEIRVIR